MSMDDIQDCRERARSEGNVIYLPTQRNPSNLALELLDAMSPASIRRDFERQDEGGNDGISN